MPRAARDTAEFWTAAADDRSVVEHVRRQSKLRRTTRATRTRWPLWCDGADGSDGFDRARGRSYRTHGPSVDDHGTDRRSGTDGPERGTDRTHRAHR